MDVIFEVNVPTNKGFFVPNGRAGKMNFGILNFGILKEETTNITCVLRNKGPKRARSKRKRIKLKKR